MSGGPAGAFPGGVAAMTSGGPTSSSGLVVADWKLNRIDFAKSLNPALSAFAYSNLLDGAALKAGSSPPAPLPNISGGALRSPAAVGQGYLGFNALSVDAATAPIDQPFIRFPTAESWLVASRVLFPKTVFTVGSFCVPCGLVGSYIQSDTTQVTNQLYVNLFDSSNHFFQAGLAAVLGSATCPVGAFFWITLEFNIRTGKLSAYFSDEFGVALSGANLLHMPPGAAAPIFAYSNDNTMGLEVSDIFAAWVAP
jgi:hypothetical protein